MGKQLTEMLKGTLEGIVLAILAGRSSDGVAPDFDLHLLGMGGEGHVNSLFPHTAATAETTKSVVAVEDSPKPPPRRITLTLPVVTPAVHL